MGVFGLKSVTYIGAMKRGGLLDMRKPRCVRRVPGFVEVPAG